MVEEITLQETTPKRETKQDIKLESKKVFTSIHSSTLDIPTSISTESFSHPKMDVENLTERTQLAALTDLEHKDPKATYEMLYKDSQQKDKLSNATLFAFANFCYNYWRDQLPDPIHYFEAVKKTKEIELNLKELSKGRNIYREMVENEIHYYWINDPEPEQSEYRGTFYMCYPYFGFPPDDQSNPIIKNVHEIRDPELLKQLAEIEPFAKIKQHFEKICEHIKNLNQKLCTISIQEQLISDYRIANLFMERGYVEQILHTQQHHQSATFYFARLMKHQASRTWRSLSSEVSEPFSPAVESLRANMETLLISQGRALIWPIYSELPYEPTPIPPSQWQTRAAILDEWHEAAHKLLQTLFSFPAHNIQNLNGVTAKQLMTHICEEIQTQIGSPPCTFVVAAAAGSFSRNEVSFCSDFDILLFIADDKFKNNAYFKIFLELLVFKTHSFPKHVLPLEAKELMSMKTSESWIDTPQNLLEDHCFSKKINAIHSDRSFPIRWLKPLYLPETPLAQALWADYEKGLHTFYYQKEDEDLFYYQKTEPWCLNQLLQEDKFGLAAEAKEKESSTSAPTSAKKTNLKTLLYPLTSAILCYSRYQGVTDITEITELLKFLLTTEFITRPFVVRLQQAMSDLHAWRLRQHWYYLHHEEIILSQPTPFHETNLDEVWLWSKDEKIQSILKKLPRGLYLDSKETQNLTFIETTLVEVVKRSAPAFGVISYESISEPPTSPKSEVIETCQPTESGSVVDSKISSSIDKEVLEIPPILPKKVEELPDIILKDESADTVPTGSTTTESKIEKEKIKQALEETLEKEQKNLSSTTLEKVKQQTLFDPLTSALDITLKRVRDNKQRQRFSDLHWLANLAVLCNDELGRLLTSLGYNPHLSIPEINSDWYNQFFLFQLIPKHNRHLYLEYLNSAGTDTSLLEFLWYVPDHDGFRARIGKEQNLWQAELSQLLAKKPKGQLTKKNQIEIAEGKSVWIQWVKNDRIQWAPLKKEYQQALFDEKRWKPKPHKKGNHLVYPLNINNSPHFWAKIYPEQPSTEQIVYQIDRHLGGFGTPCQQLVAVHHKQLQMKSKIPMTHTAMLITAHAGMHHQSLSYMSKHTPQKLKNLDFLSFARTLIRVLLTNPEDDKGDDYFLILIPKTNRYQLMRIDNERAFFDASKLVKGRFKQTEELQVKSMLYCLDQMTFSWDRDKRVLTFLEELKQIQPKALVQSLLTQAKQLHSLWKQLFPEEAVSQHAACKDPWMSLPVFIITEGVETALLKRFSALQSALHLHHPAEINGLQLLKIVQPKLAKFYSQLFYLQRKLYSPTERFEKIAGYCYKKDVEGNYQTLHSLPFILTRQLSINIPELPKNEEEQNAVINFALRIWQQEHHSVKQAELQVDQWALAETKKIIENLVPMPSSTGLTILEVNKQAHAQFKSLPNREKDLIITQLMFRPYEIPEQQFYLLEILAGNSIHQFSFTSFAAILTNELLLPVLKQSEGSIIELDISDCLLLTPDIIKSIRRYCPHLKKLKLNNLSPWDELHIGDFSHLIDLEINNANILKILTFGKLPRLKRLSITDAKALTHLSNPSYLMGPTWKLPQLEVLDTTYCPKLRIVDIQLDRPSVLVWHAALCDELPIASIYFSWMRYMPYWLFKKFEDAFEKIPPLTELNLTDSNLSVYDIQPLVSILKRKLPLKRLYLAGNQLEDKGIEALADTLTQNSTLIGLYLGKNKIRFYGLQILTEALKKRPPLRELSLYENEIGIMGASMLADVLKSKSPIMYLHLGMNDIRDVGAEDLADALKEKPLLTELFLMSNKIGDRGTEELAISLKQKPPLTCLNLAKNYISEVGAIGLADALKQNPPLTQLFLGINQIGDKGAQALADALKINSSLMYLNIVMNGIGDNGAKALAEALQQKIQLTKLDIRFNNISAKGTQDLANALKENFTLTELKMDKPNDEIKMYLKRNQDLGYQLFTAITSNQSKRLAELKAQQVSLNLIGGTWAKEFKGYTPLMIAIQSGYLPMVTEILKGTSDGILLTRANYDKSRFIEQRHRHQSPFFKQTALEMAITLFEQKKDNIILYRIIMVLIDAYQKRGLLLAPDILIWIDEHQQIFQDLLKSKEISDQKSSFSYSSSDTHTQEIYASDLDQELGSAIPDKHLSTTSVTLSTTTSSSPTPSASISISSSFPDQTKVSAEKKLEGSSVLPVTSIVSKRIISPPPYITTSSSYSHTMSALFSTTSSKPSMLSRSSITSTSTTTSLSTISFPSWMKSDVSSQTGETRIYLVLPKEGNTMNPPRIVMETAYNGRYEIWQYQRKSSDQGLLWTDSRITSKQYVDELAKGMIIYPATTVNKSQYQRLHESLLTTDTTDKQIQPPALKKGQNPEGQKEWQQWYEQWLAKHKTTPALSSTSSSTTPTTLQSSVSFNFQTLVEQPKIVPLPEPKEIETNTSSLGVILSQPSKTLEILQ